MYLENIAIFAVAISKKAHTRNRLSNLRQNRTCVLHYLIRVETCVPNTRIQMYQLREINIIGTVLSFD